MAYEFGANHRNTTVPAINTNAASIVAVAVFACGWTVASTSISVADRDLRRAAGEPRVEILEVRVEGLPDASFARSRVLRLEVPLEVEHVPHFVGAGEAEAAVHVGVDVDVPNLLAERSAQLGRHLGSREVLSGDRDR